MNGGKDGAHHCSGDSDLSQLEGDGAGMAHHAGTCLNELELQAGKRPIGQSLGQFDAAQESRQSLGQGVGQSVGQCRLLQRPFSGQDRVPCAVILVLPPK